jgi:hypothetical protein
MRSFGSASAALVALTFAASLPSGADAAPPIEITSCAGSLVPAGAAAVLVSDLDCGVSTAAIVLRNGAKLDLNGHRIVGGQNGIYLHPFNADGSMCRSCRWTIRGPGEVSETQRMPVGGT